MQLAKDLTTEPFSGELRQLFYQRALMCQWLAVVFFALFALLDLACCRENFLLFTMYRLVYVVIMVCFINLLALPFFKKYAPHLMYVAMLSGGFTISLMTVSLGGFYSDYYVGILLMIAGALSVLPLRSSQAVFVGLSMYLVYVATVLLGTGDMEKAHLVAMVNNSFFFLILVGVTAVQSFDDLQNWLKSMRVKASIHSNRLELKNYTDGLEGLVLERLEALEESDLKYRDLYNNLLDLVVLIDNDGVIRKINQYSCAMLGYQFQELEGELLALFIRSPKGGEAVINGIIAELNKKRKIEGLQLQFANRNSLFFEVELSGNLMVLEGDTFFQLVIRDISATKKMERQLHDSERLVDTSRQAAIFGLARLAECRDDDTGSHLNRIRSYVELLVLDMAAQSGLNGRITESFIEDILRSAVLHDIGKVGIPDAILLKPGRLTTGEFDVMKRHCRYGSDILVGAESNGSGGSFLLLAADIARHHHERWDGSGYPDGLSGETIPLAARIVSLADVYDALTSTRVYKAAYSHEEARELIVKERGGQFDPLVVDSFVRQEPEFKESRMKFLLQESKRMV